MNGRGRVVALVVLLVGALIRPVGAQSQAAPVHVGTIGHDEPLFWDGGYVGDDAVHSLPLVPAADAVVDRCALPQPCFRYTLTLSGPVSEPAGRLLRLALDTPMRDDGFVLRTTDPDGVVRTRTNPNQYSMELLIPAPAAGDWLVEVAPYSADKAAFRMRALIEQTPYTPVIDIEGRLLPNLQVTRLWEFGFTAPANPGNGLFPPDDVNPPLDVLGRRPLSCMVEEETLDVLRRCLRVSFGAANVGEGPFDVWFDATTDPHTMWQCVLRADGEVEAHEGGSGYFHTSHGHFHYDDIIGLAVNRVTDADAGAMELVDTGYKIGYSPADQVMPEWRSFRQSAPGTSNTGGCGEGTTARLGMSRGWGDAYRYQRPGNYVPFDSGDGLYVFQITIDPEDNVLETSEEDNTSYAYLRIVGDEIWVMETGLGTSPWDPDKQVFEQ